MVVMMIQMWAWWHYLNVDNVRSLAGDEEASNARIERRLNEIRGQRQTGDRAVAGEPHAGRVLVSSYWHRKRDSSIQVAISFGSNRMRWPHLRYGIRRSATSRRM